MPTKKKHVVTGAFGFSGKYIARGLMKMGKEVVTLTNSQERPNDLEGEVEAIPFYFDDFEKLVASLKNVSVLYNTYWVRFNHKKFSYNDAVANSLLLFEAAKKAGVDRVVHTSITNPSIDSELEYFRGKALLEKALIDSGISYAILRPAVLFGKEDILINNIAWILRKFPLFPVFGYGSYALQPIFVEDFAQLAIESGMNSENIILDAIGPETFSYESLIETLGDILGIYTPLIHLPPKVAGWISVILGKIVQDVVVTEDEIKGLMANRLYVDSPPLGIKKLTDWARENRERLGYTYVSELARRKNRKRSYC